MRVLLCLATAAAIASSPLAYAADLNATCNLPADAPERQACLCVVSLPTSPDPAVALLNNIQGSVLKSGDKGFTPITQPTLLKVGDQVLLKSDGKGLVTAGVCSHQVGPQASLIITKIGDGCGCVQLEQQQAAAPPFDPGNLAALVGGATIAGLVGIAIAAPPASP